MKKPIIIFVFISLLSTSYVASQDVELIFSHKLHAEDVEAGCTDCHQTAGESEQPSDNLLPTMETCYTCHDEDTDCGLCHKDPDNAVVYPRITEYIWKFSHAKHANQDVECTVCHVGVESSSNIFDRHLPSMAACQECHNNLEQDNYCQMCHSKGENLVPLDHRLDWVTAHGISSQLEKNSCEQCHAEKQCLDCHDKDNLDHKVHPLNFVNNHSIQAKNKNEQCYTCHEEQASCVECHRSQLVMPRNHSTAAWTNASTGGRHARQAKMDLDNCLSCHNDNYTSPICAECHIKN